MVICSETKLLVKQWGDDDIIITFRAAKDRIVAEGQLYNIDQIFRRI